MGKIKYLVSVLFIISCVSHKKSEKSLSYGGKWENPEQKIENNAGIYAVDSVKIISANSIGSEINSGTLEIKKPDGRKKINGNYIPRRSALKPREIKKVARAMDEEAYHEAKTAMFFAIGGGALYYVTFMLLNPQTIDLLMWLPALADFWLTLLAAIICILLLFALGNGFESLKKMKAAKDQHGRMFALLAILGSMAMLISMAPVVLYFLILAVVWIFTH